MAYNSNTGSLWALFYTVFKHHPKLSATIKYITQHSSFQAHKKCHKKIHVASFRSSYHYLPQGLSRGNRSNIMYGKMNEKEYEFYRFLCIYTIIYPNTCFNPSVLSLTWKC